MNLMFGPKGSRWEERMNMESERGMPQNLFPSCLFFIVRNKSEFCSTLVGHIILEVVSSEMRLLRKGV